MVDRWGTVMGIGGGSFVNDEQEVMFFEETEESVKDIVKAGRNCIVKTVK